MERIPSVIVYPDYAHSVCSYWRALGVLLPLARQGKIILSQGTGDDSWTALHGFDIAFFQRPMFDSNKLQLATAKDLNLKVVIDVDDYNYIPESHPVYDRYQKEYREKSFQQMMLLADVVLTTTPSLKKHYLQYSDNVKVIPNAMNDHWLSFQPLKTGNYVFLRCGDHHEEDIYYYKNQIIDVLNKNKWGLITAGSDPVFLKNEIKDYLYVGDFNIHKYFAYIINSPASIFAVPLLKNDFNRGKSNISWQEATLSGAAALTPYYFGLKSCTLTYKDKKTFGENLDRLIKDKELRKELHKISYQKMQKEYLLSNVNKQRLQIFKDLLK